MQGAGDAEHDERNDGRRHDVGHGALRIADHAAGGAELGRLDQVPIFR